MNTAGIIGGAGFVGSYIAEKFLNEGFRVKISARDLSNKKTFRHLEELPQAKNLGIYSLDNRDMSTLREFIDGCDYLVHCAFPFQSDFKGHAKDLSEPALTYTNEFLKVIQQILSVKKLVVALSASAINTNFPLPVDGRPKNHLYTETDEPYLNNESHPYAQAEFHADQAVRNYNRNHPNSDIEIVSIYHVLVTGPAISNHEDPDSVDLQYLFKHKIAPNPFIQMLFDDDTELAVVDVRDVAEAIYKAATTSGLHGEKYYLSNESWKVSDISRMLNHEPVTENPRFVYSGKKAGRDLEIIFKPASISFSDYLSNS